MNQMLLTARDAYDALSRTLSRVSAPEPVLERARQKMSATTSHAAGTVGASSRDRDQLPAADANVSDDPHTIVNLALADRRAECLGDMAVAMEPVLTSDLRARAALIYPTGVYEVDVWSGPSSQLRAFIDGDLEACPDWEHTATLSLVKAPDGAVRIVEHDPLEGEGEIDPQEGCDMGMVR